MVDNIYEVSNEEYIGFLDQIKPEAKDVRREQDESYACIKIYSKSNGAYLCCHEIIIKDEVEDHHFYIYNMPPDEDRCPPKPKQRFVFTTQEEVQDFFNMLMEQRGQKKDE